MPPNANVRTRLLRRAVVGLAVLALFGTHLAPVDAQSSRRRLSEARERARRLQSEVTRVAAEYTRLENELGETQAKISATRRAIDQAEAETDELSASLKDRIRAAYRSGGLEFFEFLLTSQSMREFSLRVMTLERQSSQDEDLILQLRRRRAELEMQRRDLEVQKGIEANQLSAVRDQAGKLQANFSQVQAAVKELEGRVRQEELARLFRVGRGGGGSVAGRVVSLQACPAGGPRAFSNDWGAPRGGGRRSHRGNDIFAPQGSPALAVVAGRITRTRSGGLGGLAIYLWGNDGNEYYYAHMSGFAASPGQSVSAGQTIAYVGNTGNARGTAPHIHFEIHPGGGGAINPYPSLVRVC